MKRILEVINLASSAENFIGSQFSYLSEQGGYEMHLICSAGDNLPDLAKRYDVKYKVIPINRNITPIQDIRSLLGICKYIRENNIDIIICHQEKGNLLGQLAGFIMRVPIRIVLSHGILYESMTGMKRWLIKKQDAFVSWMATNIICVSNYVRNTRIKDGVDKPSKSVVLGSGSCNGIDVSDKFNPYHYSEDEKKSLRSKYCISDADFVIGFCGRLVRDKGIEELVMAHKILLNQYPHKSIKLFVIGDVENRDAVDPDVVSYLQSCPSVIFTGRVPYNDIQKYYLPMDLFVLPSHRDGLGLTPLEAQAMGIPALVTDFTGCVETIENGLTGEYISLNPEKIAKTIASFFDSDKLNRFRENGRTFVCSRFDRAIVNENMLGYLNSIWKRKSY